MMKQVTNNQANEILLFEDEEKADQFLAMHNTGATIPKYSKNSGITYEDLGEVFKVLTGQGLYIPVPDEILWERASNYYGQKQGAIMELLSTSGLTQEETNTVITDYFNALCGNLSFSAAPACMKKVINKLPPYEAFLIDRYGLYFLLYRLYGYYSRTVYDYNDKIKNADDQTQRQYLDEAKTSYPRLRAIKWALSHRYIKLLDFSGVTTGVLVDYVNTAQELSDLYDFGLFSHHCKYAYCATPKELETIRLPKCIINDPSFPVSQWVNDFCDGAEAELNDAATQYATIINKDTPDQEREQEQERAATWSDQEKQYRFPRNFNKVMQKPILVSTSDKVTVTTTIQNYIDGWLRLPGNERFIQSGVTITDYTIHKTIIGLSLLKADNPQIAPVNGTYTYRLTMSKFAKYCDNDRDSNGYEKDAYLGCLKILNNLFVIVDKPNGTKEAINLFRLRRYTIEKDNTISNIIIDIDKCNLGGELKPLSIYDLRQLRKQAKGIFVSTFNAIIVGDAEHKKLDTIVDQCAGFSERLRQAEEAGDQEEIGRAKEYIRKHKSAFRTKVIKLFEKYLKLNVLTSFEITTNQAGEKICNWTRGDEEPPAPEM